MEKVIAKFISYNEDDTIDVVAKFFQLLKKSSSRVILLDGNLGGGKTFFTQSLGKLLGIKSQINSPTFNIMKIYDIPAKSKLPWRTLVHVDAYRLDGFNDLSQIGLDEFLADDKALLAVEWPKDLAKFLKKMKINFYHVVFKVLSRDERSIEIYETVFEK
jgi:tRNA threonylcarbamoyladenosine biosynthesis protein TsaE